MCGILGIVNFNAEEAALKPSLRFLLNRGPDDKGEYRDRNIVLCHTRLAVIDLKSASAQPIVSNGLVLVCNGEIYNHAQIKQSGTYAYATTSDCEAISHVYSAFGIEGFNMLDGSFSFALYDRNLRKLIIHRDNIGKKPLYFLNSKGMLVFSSSVLAIKDNFPEKLNIDKNETAFYLENGFIHPQGSIFEEIRPVLPGEIYEIDIENKRISRYPFKKRCPTDEDLSLLGPASLQDRLEGLLLSAVRKRIQGIPAPVLLFSGGIDSTVLAHYMLKLNKNTRLISLRQPVRLLNDEPYVRYASKLLKKEIIFVDIFNKGFYELLEQSIRNLDQPLSLYSYYFLSALSLKAKEFGKVLFTGDGGDEVFLGYGKIADWFSDSNPVENHGLICVGPKWDAALSPYALKAVSVDLAGHGFVKIDKAISENQMEARCPFLDWELMCFARKIPVDYWKKFNTPKYPLREMLLRNGFPMFFVKRKKIGFSYPFRYLMIPKYNYLKKYLEDNSKSINYFFGREMNKVPLAALYLKFDFYWNIFVFLKYMEYNKIIL
ncbi:MAG TPA: asparagine synthetase B [Candidatus Margulisiibacteriota bacterium]|nr:asparagine synthetase B [Candidatus Margulisiibacteriota bacterium]